MTGTYGLVVCGGQSARMGTDKSLLNYHGKPQRYHLYEQLQPFCERVFLSCNEQQVAAIPAGYNIIADEAAYRNIGPMAALLSPFDRYPGQTFIVLGCDYPFFSINEIKQLADAALQQVACAAFCHEENNIYEPLLAMYRPAAGIGIKKAFGAQQYSLQRLLKDLQAVKLCSANIRSVQSVDTPAGYEAAAREIRQTR